MANTFTQINIHIIFAVGDRKSLISQQWTHELYSYIAGACRHRKHYVHAINGTADHLHLLIGMHPTDSVSELVQSLKVQSSKWINEQYLHGDFCWQHGYGAFSYSKSLIPSVKRYIENQQEHHKRISFHEELISILEKAGIAYEPAYLLKGYLPEGEPSEQSRT